MGTPISGDPDQPHAVAKVSSGKIIGAFVVGVIVGAVGGYYGGKCSATPPATSEAAPGK